MLRSLSPGRNTTQPNGATDIDVARAFGERDGFEAAIDYLESLAKFVEAPREVEETFEDPYRDEFDRSVLRNDKI
jgi:hypothetical protein